MTETLNIKIHVTKYSLILCLLILKDMTNVKEEFVCLKDKQTDIKTTCIMIFFISAVTRKQKIKFISNILHMY